MPKINVYLPDDLADAVRDAGVPVSAVCQRALEQAVRRVADIRAAVAGEADPAAAVAELTQLTERARQVLVLAVEQAQAGDAPGVDTGHLLAAILSEGTNLAVHVLRSADVDLGRLAGDLTGRPSTEHDDDGAGDNGRRFSGPAATALQAAVTEALSLDHNYVGCEHLLLGLAAEPDGIAGTALRAQGADHRALRRAVVAALAGYVHLRAQRQQATASGTAEAASLIADMVRRELAPITERLAAVEQHLGLADPA